MYLQWAFYILSKIIAVAALAGPIPVTGNSLSSAQTSIKR
jgi:hypothetical protein